MATKIIPWTMVASDESNYDGPFQVVKDPDNEFGYIILDNNNLVTIDDVNWRVYQDTVEVSSANAIIYLECKRGEVGAEGLWEREMVDTYYATPLVDLDWENLQDLVPTCSVYHYKFPIAVVITETLKAPPTVVTEEKILAPGIYQIQYGNIQHFPDTYKGPFALRVDNETYEINIRPGKLILSDQVIDTLEETMSIPDENHQYVYYRIVWTLDGTTWTIDFGQSGMFLSVEEMNWVDRNENYILIGELRQYVNEREERRFAVYQRHRDDLYPSPDFGYSGPFKLKVTPTGVDNAMELWVDSGGLFIDRNMTSVPSTVVDPTREKYDQAIYVVLVAYKNNALDPWQYQYEAFDPATYAELKPNQFTHYYLIGTTGIYYSNIYQRQYGDIHDMTDDYTGPFALSLVSEDVDGEGTVVGSVRIEDGFLLYGDQEPFRVTGGDFSDFSSNPFYYVQYTEETNTGVLIAVSEHLPLQNEGIFNIYIGSYHMGDNKIYQRQYGNIILGGGGGGDGNKIHFKGTLTADGISINGGQIIISDQIFDIEDTDFTEETEGQKYYVTVDLVANTNTGIQSGAAWPEAEDNERVFRICSVADSRIEEWQYGDIYADEYMVQCQSGDQPEFLKEKVKNNEGASKHLVMETLGEDGDKRYVQLYGLNASYANTGIEIALDDNGENWVFYAKLRDILNIGDGVGLFKQINADHKAEFKTLTSINESVVITDGEDTINLESKLNAINIGDGLEVYKGWNETLGVDEFRTIGSVDESIDVSYVSGVGDDWISFSTVGKFANVPPGVGLYKGYNETTKQHEFLGILEKADSAVFVQGETNYVSIDVRTQFSIETVGGRLQLVNDQENPGNSAYANINGSKGWKFCTKQKIVTNVYVDDTTLKYDYVYGYVINITDGGTVNWATGEECD